MLVLGIETSCDDTSVCLLEKTDNSNPQVLSHLSFGQEKVLKQWGGVVPEIAARNHLEKITPLLDTCFKEANKQISDLDLIGVTTHPGLLGPLLTGLNAAKTISLLQQIPINSVNHLFAHLEAIFLTEDITYPYLGVLVSGGHSLFILMLSSDKYKVLGGTIDDAAGEAFDKGGKLMGLGYPAGRIIDDLSKKGDANKFSFPIGLKSSANAQLSFSGVKTSLRNFLEQNQEYICHNEVDINKQMTADLCASYQKSIIDALVLKLRYAVKKADSLGYQNLPIVVGGGVACNSKLREEIKNKHENSYFVKPSFCTDNGAMIANYALRTNHLSIPFPQCLSIDAKSRFVKKSKEANK